MINIVDNGTAQAIINKAPGVRVGGRDVTHNFYCHPAQASVENGAEEVNTCTGIRRILIDEKAAENFAELVGLAKEKEVWSHLFTTFNGEKFGPFLEISHSEKLMAGDVGIEIGFTKGAGFCVEQKEVLNAIPQYVEIRDLLTSWGYRGELTVALAEDYTCVDIRFGHNWAFFAMYCEAAKGNVAGVLDFLVGNQDTLELYDTCLVAALVSAYPFPVAGVSIGGGSIRAPITAEKHLWRIRTGGYEPFLITTHGTSVLEASRRVTRTIENCLAYDDSLQYRNDYGRGEKFLLVEEKYIERRFPKKKAPSTREGA